MPDLDALAESRLVARYRETKQILGRYLLYPEVLTSVVETNLAIKNKVRQNFRAEEERILSESQRILELEAQVPMDLKLDQELSVFRQKLEEFERKQRSDNVKLEDIAFLRRQVEDLMPRLARRAPSGPHLVSPADLAPEGEGKDDSPVASDEILTEHFRQVVDALGGTDNLSPPRAVALDREVYHLRLEPREVIAFRRVFVTSGKHSRIVPLLDEGAGVTLVRGDLNYVVTEYGIAYLQGKNIRERAMDLIAIAHPTFRPWLIEEAKKEKLIYSDQSFIPGERGMYPEALETYRTTFTGMRIMLRPVKISDEPLLKDFFYSLSDKSMYHAFHLHQKGHAPRAALGVRGHRIYPGAGHSGAG